MYGKELVVPVYLKNGKAAVSPADDQPYGSGDAAALAVDASNHGADAILVFDFSSGDAQHDAAIAQIKANHYADRFAGNGKTLTLVGLAFSKEKRTVVDAAIEEV